MKRILIIDDEAAICSSLAFALEDKYEVMTTTDPSVGVTWLEHDHYDLCLLDLKIGQIDGIDVLRQIKEVSPKTIVLMITAYGTIATSVRAVREGAYSYLTKPINIEELHSVIEQAFRYQHLNEQVDFLSQELEKKYSYEGIIGKSKAMKAVFHLIGKVREVDSNVLLTGESGTGKELVAKALHFSGKRKKAHFEVVNCAAIPDQLLESELFGYEKGAFTGAISSKKGKFEQANGGTIFLDEIGDMPLALQVKLLRVLQEKVVTRLGSNREIQLNVRVIAATNKNLDEAVRKGEFREDLYFRLNVIKVPLPALRERKEDIPYLIKHFIGQFNEEMGLNVKGLTKQAQRILLDYEYPGNIRELSNIIESSMVLADDEYIEATDLPNQVRKINHASNGENGLYKSFIGLPLKEIEKHFILATLEANKGHRKKTAHMLGISERSLRDKLKQYEHR
ncbi:sigma-54 dependent transcriptional regulator [Alkalihalobacillus oceani]|uniref:Sigma-54 dependent transcriptional regulator n=1 Tax=Halalkalibacter oceani TaxID=1653776 RepID=A0A9X2DPV9_9BACI|nr:sigma-54 dependent transcriptional regulator [Halalkalibacter oceani]MCM3714212.1 sigma-54 dependent transcriptional regulator [Halalkalibacter oceani]